MSADELPQRVATLEAHRIADVQTLSELRQDMHNVANDVRAIKETVVRSRGFIAGASFVVVTVWTAIFGVGIALWDKWTS